MDREAAIKACKNGAIAACISAGMTALIVGLSIYNSADGQLAIFNNPLNVIDVFMFLAFAWGVHKRSRASAVVLFLYFIAGKIIYTAETGNIAGLGIAAVFLFYYGKAIQGAFVYHRIERKENPDYKKTSKWWLIPVIPAITFVGFIIIYGVFSATGYLPSTRVLAKVDISEHTLQSLIENKVLREGDEVSFLYAQGLNSIGQLGHILAQDRVIIYGSNEMGELEAYELYFFEITEVTQESPGGVIADSTYRVITQDPNRWLKLSLSIERDGHKDFINELKRRVSVEKKKMNDLLSAS